MSTAAKKPSTAARSITAEAHSRIPGYDEAAAELAVARRWVQEVAGPVPVAIDPEAELREAALRGDPFPMDLAARAREVQAAIVDRQNAQRMAKEFLDGAAARVAAATAHGADPALEYLDMALGELVEEVRATDLRAASADATTVATDPAAAAAVRAATELVERYREIRTVQLGLVRAASGNRLTDSGRRHFLLVGQVAGFLDQEAYWLGQRRENYRSPRDGAPSAEQRAYADWLTQVGLSPLLDALSWGGPLPHGGLVESARFLARLAEEASPWVPTMGQLFEAWDHAAAAVNGSAATPREAADGIAAAHRLEQLTGYHPKGLPEPMEPKTGTARRLPWGHPLRRD